MLQKIRKLFEQIGSGTDVEVRDEQDVRMISAALLAEVATVDHNLDQREQDTLVQLLQATSLYEFTQTVNDRFDERNKYLLVRQMWQVALADEVIETFEEHLIRRVAELIYLPHGLFTRARAEARKISRQ
jgi:uncharacterized tellurite resistance protein B-like protein